jgi:hypothetical protein
VTTESSIRLTPEEIENLHKDLSRTMLLRDAESASQVVPPGILRERIRNIGTEVDTERMKGRAVGAVTGGLLSAGVGALTAGAGGGLQKVPRGALRGAIPGAAVGGVLGDRRVRNRQLLEALTEELGPGAQVKRANVEVGFKEILEELHKSKRNNTLTPEEIGQAIKDLKAGRGYNLSHPEKLIFNRVILEKKDGPKPVYHRRSRPVSLPPVDIPDVHYNPSKMKVNVPVDYGRWSVPEKAERTQRGAPSKVKSRGPKVPEPPRFNPPKINTPKFETVKLDTPKFDTLKLDVPKYEAPKVKVQGSPSVSIPVKPSKRNIPIGRSILWAGGAAAALAALGLGAAYLQKRRDER